MNGYASPRSRGVVAAFLFALAALIAAPAHAALAEALVVKFRGDDAPAGRCGHAGRLPLPRRQGASHGRRRDRPYPGGCLTPGARAGTALPGSAGSDQPPAPRRPDPLRARHVARRGRAPRSRPTEGRCARTVAAPDHRQVPRSQHKRRGGPPPAARAGQARPHRCAYRDARGARARDVIRLSPRKMKGSHQPASRIQSG